MQIGAGANREEGSRESGGGGMRGGVGEQMYALALRPCRFSYSQ